MSNFFSKGPQTLLWAGSWAAHIKISISGTSNLLNYCAIFTVKVKQSHYRPEKAKDSRRLRLPTQMEDIMNISHSCMNSYLSTPSQSRVATSWTPVTGKVYWGMNSCKNKIYAQHLPFEIKWNANLTQLGNFIRVFLARHVSGTYAHHQEH